MGAIFGGAVLFLMLRATFPFGEGFVGRGTRPLLIVSDMIP